MICKIFFIYLIKKKNIMELTNINYQFTPLPTNLTILLDLNCRSMLFTLIQLSSYFGDDRGEFFRTNEDLRLEAALGQKVVIAACSALHRAGIITVRSVGKSKGKIANYYRVNFERFKDYEAYSMEELKNPELAITTDNYKAVGYCPSYLEGAALQTPSDSPKIEQRTNNIESIENKDIEDNIINNNFDILINDKYLSSLQSYDFSTLESVIDTYLSQGLDIAKIYEALASTNWIYYTKFKEYCRHSENREELYNDYRDLIDQLNEKHRPTPRFQVSTMG